MLIFDLWLTKPTVGLTNSAETKQMGSVRMMAYHLPTGRQMWLPLGLSGDDNIRWVGRGREGFHYSFSPRASFCSLYQNCVRMAGISWAYSSN